METKRTGERIEREAKPLPGGAGLTWPRRSLLPLRPFLVSGTTLGRDSEETCFVDAWDTRKGTARMKSFEWGHTMNSAEVSEALEEWASGDRTRE